ncbi:MAG: multifunctional CCA addition/repair protein [Pseudomonadota bacterium]
MQVYLVGGAVRDGRLGLPVVERDWCVVGGTEDELLAEGYRRVGKSFPVFLHPETGEEYALARTERKTGPGHGGFAVIAPPTVTIEEDLERRDLTINAMAQSTNGELIDPFGGMDDLNARRLRHVSPAFREDPLRVLRTARFAARFSSLGFDVADETKTLMRTMADDGELETLVGERVWQETSKALGYAQPDVYFSTLRECGALAKVFPEVDRLFGVPQPEKWHPEIDCGVHTLMSLRMAAKLSAALEVRFAVLVHDLGKATTPKEKLPSHPGHELRSKDLVTELCGRLPVPSELKDVALLVAEFHTHVHRAHELKPATVLKVLERCDAFRRSARFEHVLLACEADARGRTGLEDRAYPQADRFRAALEAAGRVSAREFVDLTSDGREIAEKLRRARLNAIKVALSD